MSKIINLEDYRTNKRKVSTPSNKQILEDMINNLDALIKSIETASTSDKAPTNAKS